MHASHVINIVISGIATLIILYILKQHYCRKNKSDQKNKSKSKESYEKLLNRLALITFLCVIYTSCTRIIEKIPIICQLAGSALISASLQRYFLTMYQIARLKYIFWNKQIHSTKYGYPGWTFIVLYIIGILLYV